MLSIAQGYRYCLDEVDEFLSEIDGDVDHGVCLGRGPFSVFPAAERLFCSSQLSDNETVNNEVLTVIQTSDTSSEETSNDIEAEPQTSTTLRSAEITTQGTPMHDNRHANVHISDYSSRLPGEAVTIDSSIGTTSVANFRSPSSALESDLILKPTTPKTQQKRSSSINELYTSIFGSKTVDQLLSHYMLNIADLLLPILHENNPWRNLYMPAIFDAAASHYFAPDQAQGKANSALYYAALSTASFHIWYGQRDKSDFLRIGTFYRCKAMRSLQLAVSSKTSGTKQRDLLMAMLSLVTNGV